MKFIIKHEIRGRLRIHVVQGKMTCAEADTLFWFLDRQKNITDVKVYERTADAVICYTGDRSGLIRLLKSFRYEDVTVPETVVRNSGRALNASYKEKLIAKVLLHYGGKLLMPSPLRAGLVMIRSLRYLAAGLRCIRKRKIEVPLLDARRSGSLSCGGILIPPGRSCSCWGWENFWKSGPTKNPWGTWRGACP